MFDVNEYAEFHPNKASEFVAVVPAYKKTPVRTVLKLSAPFLPKFGSSARYAPTSAPGTPSTWKQRQYFLEVGIYD